jgi:cathepsin B
MKTTSAIVLAAASVAASKVPSDFAYVNDQSHIDYLNSQVSWKAGAQDKFDGKTFMEMRHLFGTHLSHISNYEDILLPEISMNVSTIPMEFNAYVEWASLVHPIRDQERCGSCWAFSSSEAFSDRSSIKAGKLTAVLSPEDMVTCDNKDGGCQGGQLPYAWSYIKNTGLTTDACMPYMSGTGKEGTCRTTCADGSTFSRSKASIVGPIKGNLNLQKELMTNGPIQVAFEVYKSFMNYDGGIYEKPWFELIPEGGHAVKLVGWGTEGGKDYWTVANSWDTTWGENGFFRIIRGKDECGIETMGPPYAGMP